MAGERTYPILPCPDLVVALDFYVALGFTTTYQQQRPNPYAVVASEDIQIHLARIEGFEPEASVSSAILTVPDAERLRDQFASGLREHFGKIPDSGIPRLLRLRRKAGAATGFSVVDTGGNWLRVYREGEPEETPEMSRSALRTTRWVRRTRPNRGELP